MAQQSRLGPCGALGTVLLILAVAAVAGLVVRDLRSLLGLQGAASGPRSQVPEVPSVLAETRPTFPPSPTLILHPVPEPQQRPQPIRIPPRTEIQPQPDIPQMPQQSPDLESVVADWSALALTDQQQQILQQVLELVWQDLDLTARRQLVDRLDLLLEGLLQLPGQEQEEAISGLFDILEQWIAEGLSAQDMMAYLLPQDQ